VDEIGGPVHGRVSIIIPFRDRYELLRNCLRSLRSSTYRRFEIILVDNGSSEPRLQRYLKHLSTRRRIRVVDCPGPFNHARLCNEGARCAAGEHLLFLNNDIEVLAPDWLERLLRVAHHPEVGIVGATLVFPDGTLQHTGIFRHPDGRWVHIYRGKSQEYPGRHGELRHIRTVPAVTAACLLMRRKLFTEVGGFDEKFPLDLSDVDLCQRVQQRGLLVVVSPHARLLHFESLSRGYARAHSV
jgi:GT2 family glycosyltransferase